MKKPLILLLAVWLLCLSVPAGAAPSASLWPKWLPFAPDSMAKIDHRPFEAFLTRYLRQGPGDSRQVAYGDVTPDDRDLLKRYIRGLGEVEVSRYNRQEQMAFWLNLYNALTIDVILDHYPMASIRDMQAPDGGIGIANLRLAKVDGVQVSINDIAHRILRPIFRDPRLHYALSCGAISCPPLSPMPFSSDNLDAQLSAAAMTYVNDPAGVTLDGDRLVISSLYRWYQSDFGGSELDVIHHLMAYAAPELAMKLQDFSRVHGDRFDWNLSDGSE